MQQFQVVKIIELQKDPSKYNDWDSNIRNPQIGDEGTITDVLDAETCVVECVDKDGMTLWLSTFDKNELEVIA